MNKLKTTLGHCIVAIWSEDKKGLIGQVMIPFNKRNHEVISLNVARTDISDLVLITLETIVPTAELPVLLRRLEKIVEVYQVRAYPAGEAGPGKVGFFRLSSKVISPSFWTLLQKYGAVISSLCDDTLVIRYSGSDDALQELYSRLEGPNLLAFCKSGLIAEESLFPIEFNDNLLPN